MDIVKIDGEKLSTTSKIIADVFGKVHRVVLKSIDELECSDEFRAHNFMLSYYTSPQNKKIKCYDITKDGFYFLCMGFTGKKAAKWKEAFINAFNELEKGVINIDAKMTLLARQGDNLKKLGSEWSKFGHDISREKKKHTAEVNELVSKVQMKLDFK